MGKYISLEAILGKEDKELIALKKGEYETANVGLIPYSAIDFDEYKAAKKDCLKMVKNGTGGMSPELDDDKLMVKIILAGVDKDDRSTFTFANKDLLKKLKAVSADEVIGKLLSPGEIYNMAIEIQNISGFGKKAEKDKEEEIKKS